ncbi:MAG: aminotransferase class I/II-fold pyridoxal phosphate-dependent enzyme [Thiohalocapsa sp. PB-PSB1]|jgi:8-amino-7-oxononanoate synthase|nr:MAG: aminotransferase class I/II-fold pyridoxal phosphate-dependent enzyme [Thiohalocapsa sp. PB-PSB1]
MRIDCEVYDSTEEIDPTKWDSLVPSATGLRHNVLKIFEYSGINNLTCQYLLFTDAIGRPQAKANLYQVGMDFTTLDPTLSATARHTLRQWHPDFLNLSMIECGLFAMNGDGLVCPNSELLADVIHETTKQMQLIADRNLLDLLIVRDVPLDRFEYYYNTLSPKGFYPVPGFTNSVIDLHWESLDEFFSELNSKNRYKLKTSLHLEEKFNISVEIIQDYEHLAPEMARLWKNVNESAKEYSREQLDEAFFRTAAQLNRGDSEIVAFFHAGKLVAFMWNLIGTEDYHMADWGVDYGFPQYREANLYRAASVFSMRRALELNKDRMQLGMTNYTPKKLLGAQFQPLIYFVKHREDASFSRALARMMTDAIQQPEPLNYFNVSDVWSQPSLTQSEYKLKLRQLQSEYQENDCLHPLEQFYDVDILRLGGLYTFHPPLHEHEDQLQLSGNNDLGLLGQLHASQASNNAFTLHHAAVQPAAFFSGVSKEEAVLAESVAAHLQQHASIIFANGYLAHLGALSIIAHDKVTVFMDEQNSPVLWDAVKLGGAQVVAYSHGDYAQLKKALENHTGRPALIVSQAIFSLFGDRADIDVLCEIKNSAKARLYIDESLSYGICGPQGAGLCIAEGRQDDVDIIAGTFSHAIGLEGGFVAGGARIMDYIKHNSSPLLFSNRLPTATVVMITAALDLCRGRADSGSELCEKARYLAMQLQTLGYEVVFHHYPVISLVLGDPMLALSVKKYCFDQNLMVTSLTPPIVPEDFSGIRLSLHAYLTGDDLQRIISVFKSVREVIASSTREDSDSCRDVPAV